MAGRKDKNTVAYFPHYCIPSKTIFILENQFGHLGYSIWFKTLERLGANENHYIDLRNDTDLLYLISKMKITEQQLNDIYDLLAKLDAIDKELWDKKIIYSENFIKNISDVYKRRSKDVYTKQHLCEHILNLSIHKSKKCKQKSTKESKVDKSKVNKDIPTYSDFKNYALENKSNIDEESLKLKYQSWVENKWQDGNNKPIKNWKTKLLNTIPYLKESTKTNSEDKIEVRFKGGAVLKLTQERFDKEYSCFDKSEYTIL